MRERLFNDIDTLARRLLAVNDYSKKKCSVSIPGRAGEICDEIIALLSRINEYVTISSTDLEHLTTVLFPLLDDELAKNRRLAPPSGVNNQAKNEIRIIPHTMSASSNRRIETSSRDRSSRISSFSSDMTKALEASLIEPKSKIPPAGSSMRPSQKRELEKAIAASLADPKMKTAPAGISRTDRFKLPQTAQSRELAAAIAASIAETKAKSPLASTATATATASTATATASLASTATATATASSAACNSFLKKFKLALNGGSRKKSEYTDALNNIMYNDIKISEPYMWYVFPHLYNPARASETPTSTTEYTFPSIEYVKAYVADVDTYSRIMKAIETLYNRLINKFDPAVVKKMSMYKFFSLSDIKKLISSVTLFKEYGSDAKTKTMAEKILNRLLKDGKDKGIYEDIFTTDSIYVNKNSR